MAKINGGPGDDILVGTAGDDIINGKNGHDTLYGIGGNDVLVGGKGGDTLYGGDGDDVLNAGAGADWLTGGAGADAFTFDLDATSDYRLDTIYDLDFTEGDTIVIEGVVISSDAELAAFDGMNGFEVYNFTSDPGTPDEAYQVVIFNPETRFVISIEDYSI